jgi:endoglucanase
MSVIDPLLAIVNKSRIPCIVLICAVLGSIWFITSHAATPYVSTEPETGTITGSASSVADMTASSDKAVKFGTAAVGSTTSYTVVGSTIKDSSGNAVILHGIDQSGLEFSCSNSLATSAYATMKNSWNANAVRIAVDQDFWLTTASHTCSGYPNTIDATVQAVRSQNMIAIIDLHWSDMGNVANAPGQQCMPDQNSVTFWQQVAAKYKSNPNVWFELYNEPHPNNWTIWKNGGSVCGFNSVGMQTMVNTVRSAGANNIVLVGGDGYAAHLDGVPLLSGTNIVYAIHPYASPTGANSWSSSDFDTRFGNLSATVPVISTEFGDFQCGGSYDQSTLDYFRAHKVGYTAWAWVPNGCAYPSLLSNANGSCAVSMGCTIQQDMLKYPVDNFK